MLIGLVERMDGIEDEHQGAPPKLCPLSNLRTLRDINFKLGMPVGHDERMDGIEDEHQGAVDKPKTGGRHLGHGQPTFCSFNL